MKKTRGKKSRDTVPLTDMLMRQLCGVWRAGQCSCPVISPPATTTASTSYSGTGRSQARPSTGTRTTDPMSEFSSAKALRYFESIGISDYTVKKVSGFPVPARETLVSYIPAGNGKTANLFYSVLYL
jgi:hypothetical protein